MKEKYPLEARAKILTDDGREYDVGCVFFYEDEDSFSAGIEALCRKIFSEKVYTVFDTMDAIAIRVNHIAAIHVEKDIPIV